jgi:hypothetical protein
MELLVLVPAFLRALSVALTSGKFAGWAFKLADISALGALLIELGEEGQQQLQALTDQINGLVQSKEAPTEGEWAQLEQVHQASKQLIEAYLQRQLAAAAPAGVSPPTAVLADGTAHAG